jgi:hypothetical protein
VLLVITTNYKDEAATWLSIRASYCCIIKEHGGCCILPALLKPKIPYLASVLLESAATVGAEQQKGLL